MAAMGGTEDILFLVIFIICNGNSYQFIQNAEIHTIKKKKIKCGRGNNPKIYPSDNDQWCSMKHVMSKFSNEINLSYPDIPLTMLILT